MTQHPVALITGGARRVGRAIALRLAAAGYHIGITYLSSENDANELVTELRGQFDIKAIAIRADLTTGEPAADHIAHEISQHFGRLSILVNNASLYLPGTLADTQPAQLQKMFAIHVEAPLLLAQRFEPMLRSARGHIVNMSDLLAERPWPQYLGYCATKAALSNLTISLARAMAPDVTVNAIAPGVVEWPEDYPQAEREKYLKRIPLGRAGTADEVAALVHFLCTEGSYITGQIIRLDGGRSVM